MDVVGASAEALELVLSSELALCRTRFTRAVSAARVKTSRAVDELPPIAGYTVAAPANHFAARPDYYVQPSWRRCFGRGCGRPTIRVGIVSPAGGISCVVDDHFAAGPRCRATAAG